MNLEPLLIAGVLLAGVAGCGDACGSASRFTDENGLTVLIVCGEISTVPPSTTSASAGN